MYSTVLILFFVSLVALCHLPFPCRASGVTFNIALHAHCTVSILTILLCFLHLFSIGKGTVSECPYLPGTHFKNRCRIAFLHLERRHFLARVVMEIRRTFL
ncbi:hypothetical protein C8Q74DRAFT_1243612 [Fomes fomentarius]|nr:hypothetical protein C8Q74DRAFT_1243612 [Fomes fomentarius]